MRDNEMQSPPVGTSGDGYAGRIMCGGAVPHSSIRITPRPSNDRERRHMIELLRSNAGWIAAGVVSWAAIFFIGLPLQKFSDLRSEVIHRTGEYANVRARWRPERDDQGAYSAMTEVEGLTDKDRARLEVALTTFRDLASRMRAFAHNNRVATWLVGLAGYDVQGASAGLFGLSNAYDTYGENRAFQANSVRTALKIKAP